MDEFEDEDYFGSYGLDLDEFGRVACRALVLHPTKHKVRPMDGWVNRSGDQVRVWDQD